MAQPKALYQSQRYTLWPDRVVEGDFVATAVSATEIDSNYPVSADNAAGLRKWTLGQDISQYPQSASDDPLLDALYHLSLDELARDTRADGAFNAGAKWEGVWTRDVSYSIVLSLAAIQPEAAKASLLHKVKRDRIVQDTGTGGSWPVSTDRMTWALAAWEIYLVTGDHDWLSQSYQVVRNSMLDDQEVVIDPVTGLARGESSFLDWREQTYPRWMEPADIYSSEEIGTNTVYYRTYRILAQMARLLDQPSNDWDARAERIRASLNQLFWRADRGYYGAYRYGRLFPALASRTGALGDSFAILFDIAAPERQDQILRSQPLMELGIPTVFPQTPNIPPYHNRSVWPFVQAFWNLAAAKRGDAAALLHGLGAVYRPAALFLTNKENFVLETGSPVGTEINSDRQLWSVAANLAMTYRVFFGMSFEVDGLHLRPVVPEPFGGTRKLSNFHYREATLSIEVKGYGNKIKEVLLDGKPSSGVISPQLSGDHTISIQMENNPLPPTPVHLVNDTVAPETPEVRLDGGKVIWAATEGAAQYRVYRNGAPVATVKEAGFPIPESARLFEYQVSALDKDGVESFLSAPVIKGASPLTFPIGSGGASPQESYATLERTGITGLSVTGVLPAAGRYSLSFRYANGSGPINTENKCAIRTLFIDGKQAGPVVFPQRGTDQWANWGTSSSLISKLSAGSHRFELRFLPFDENMNGEVNKALIASMAALPVD